jgi:hypothetical protein
MPTGPGQRRPHEDGIHQRVIVERARIQRPAVLAQQLALTPAFAVPDGQLAIEIAEGRGRHEVDAVAFCRRAHRQEWRHDIPVQAAARVGHIDNMLTGAAREHFGGKIRDFTHSGDSKR